MDNFQVTDAYTKAFVQAYDQAFDDSFIVAFHLELARQGKAWQVSSLSVNVGNIFQDALSVRLPTPAPFYDFLAYSW